MGSKLAFGILAASLLLRAQTAEPCANTPSYSPCEMVFELSDQAAAANPRPYASVELRVEFRSPRAHSYPLPAFWDGGRRMVVRFTPTEPGSWDYLVNSNIADWNGKKGSFTTVASDDKGFIRPGALHHWEYTEKANGLDQPHLWMGASEPRLAFVDDAAFRAIADARAAQKFNHLRIPIVGQGSDPAIFQGPDAPNVTFFQRLDQRVRYLNQKGLIADLVLGQRPSTLTAAFTSADALRRFARYMGARYAAYNVTWQAVDTFEGDPNGRAVLREFGAALKQADPYLHPRTSGASITSTPLLDDGWMDFAYHGTIDDAIGGVEHQVYPVPFVVNIGREDSGAGKTGPDDVDAATFRHRLWNATMNGQYPTYANTGSGGQYLNSAGAKAMSVWYDVMATTRHWELEPYFDINNGRALALEDAEYLAYIEKPGPLELIVEKHGYDVIWINPADGAEVRRKFSGDHFTTEPPDKSHDWLLHVVRLSHLESMNKSFKFESRENSIGLQEIEVNPTKVPFAIEQPTGDVSVSHTSLYSAKITKETRATRSILWIWQGDVAADGQGFRIIGTAQKGDWKVPADVARNLPATMHLRLYGMNANGKVYEADTGCELKK